MATFVSNDNCHLTVATLMYCTIAKTSFLLILVPLNLVKMSSGSLLRYYTTKAHRISVPKDKVDWNVDYPDYSPPYYDSDRLIGKPWADPPIDKGDFKWNQIDGNISRKSYEGDYTIDDKGYPLYPKGRTGIRGRGLLGRWGPNFAADPIVTRWKRSKSGEIVKDPITDKPILQLVVVQRRDNKMWALPGGMVDPGEDTARTALREFMEEATNSLKKSKEQNEKLKGALEELFSKGKNVFNGIVNDPRNTDNAWIETSAYSYHDDDNVTNIIRFEAGDDAMNTKWLDVNKDNALHASHLSFVRIVSEDKGGHW